MVRKDQNYYPSDRYPRTEPHWAITAWSLVIGVAIIAIAAALYVDVINPHLAQLAAFIPGRP